VRPLLAARPNACHCQARMRYLVPLSLLVLATTLEAGGDAIIRIGLRANTVPFRVLLMLVGAVVLYGYGLTLNLAPLDWGRLIGAYVATFFVVGQVINLVIFQTAPTLPIIVGGLFILTGGAVITFWHRQLARSCLFSSRSPVRPGRITRGETPYARSIHSPEIRCLVPCNVPVLALTGALAAKGRAPPSTGTLPTTGGLWVGLLVGVIVIVGGLTYLPALALGPVAEHVAMLRGAVF
jgi:drug/metabolite transporter superfamily protein YnfA